MNSFPFVDIQEASNRNEGLDKVNNFNPNLIFLEINLQAHSGLDLARRIKIKRPDTIIVILTSYNLPEYRTAAEESGVTHVVVRDECTGADLIDLVSLILSDQIIDQHEDRVGGEDTLDDSQ